MIPVSLTLKGIYSYQDKEQKIDFTKLSSSGLFGIFGAVGSGKSTILEAISFALYGETERLNNRDKRGYNMMNLKSDNLLIDFIFVNAADKLKYRFIAKASRNKKRFDDVNTIERTALKQSNEEWIPINIKSAEEISGLSYVNFRRTVIIPQGQFQEFLQLGDTERSKMMKELFHLEKFDLFEKTRILENKNNSSLENLKGQIEQLTDISSERLIEIDNELIDTKNVLKISQESFETLKSEIELQKQHKTLSDKIVAEEKMLQQLDGQRPLIDKLKKDLQQFNNCNNQFSGSINKLNDFNKNQTIQTAAIKELKFNFEAFEKRLNQLEPVFEKLKLRYENREELNKNAEDCRKILQTRIIEDEITKIKDRLAKGDLEIQKTLSKIESLTNEKIAGKELISEIKSKQKDLSELSKIKTWYIQLEVLQNEISEIEKEFLGLKQQSENYIIAFAQIASKFGISQKDFQTVNLAEKVAGNIHQLEMDLESGEQELKHLKIKKGLLSYSEQLVEGEPCPVCGATHHPEKMRPTDLTNKLDKLEKQSEFLKLELKKLHVVEKELGTKSTEFSINNERLIAIADKLEKSNHKQNVHKGNYQFDLQINEKELEESFTEAENEKKQIQKLEVEFFKTEKILESEIKNKDKYQFALNELNIALATKSANYDTISGQVANDQKNEYANITIENLELKIKEIELDYQKLIKDYHTVEKQIVTIKPEMDKLLGTIETKQKDLSQLINDTKILGEKLNAEIEAKGFNSLADVQVILNKQIDQEKEDKKIRDFENQFFGASSQLIKLKQELNGRIFVEEDFAKKKEEFEKTNKVINELHKKLGSLEKDKKEQQLKLIEKEKLKLEFDKFIERGENIKTLLKIFKGSGFVNYISSVYLQNLVNAANKRFQPLTGQKLRLELTPTNDFLIRDYLNEGKLRSVKTLSGGQTFQAALSLALALADSIQSINKAEDNFFFLDEGFGSLDKNSLAIVFESLKSLRHENRIVGIISHVEELQQEIDNYLTIENSTDSGSLVRTSWE